MTPGTLPGVWLLDLDTGGEVVRVSTAPVAIASRVYGTARYVGGLAPYTGPLDGDAASLDLHYPGVARDRARLGPLDGRRATLRYWRGEAFVEDAAIGVDGVVVGATYAPPDDPDGLSISVERAPSTRCREILSPQASVNATTTATTWDDAITGAAYPIVLGAPGVQTSDSDTASPLPGSTGLTIEQAGGLGTVLVALGHVEADTVEVYVLGATGGHDTYPTIRTTDTLGTEITTVDLASGPASLAPDPNEEIAIGWSTRSGYGRGLRHKGRVVRGLGDVLAWGADVFAGDLTYDHREIEARRASLNRYQIDTHVNELGVSWDAWVAAELEETYQIELAAGPRGLYWRDRPWAVDPRHVAATFEAGSRGVVRSSGVSYAYQGEGAVAEVSVRYARHVSGEYVRTRTYGATAGAYLYGQPDPSVSHHRLCAAARELTRTPRSVTVEAPHSWAPSTADLVAVVHVQRLSMPARYVEYTLGADVLDLPAYATVRIVDGAAGLDDLALLLPRPQIEGPRSVRVGLQIPPA